MKVVSCRCEFSKQGSTWFFWNVNPHFRYWISGKSLVSWKSLKYTLQVENNTKWSNCRLRGFHWTKELWVVSLRWLQGDISIYTRKLLVNLCGYSIQLLQCFTWNQWKEWLKFDTKRSAQLRIFVHGHISSGKMPGACKMSNSRLFGHSCVKRRLSGSQNLHSFAEECRYKTNFKWLKKALCLSHQPVTRGNHRNVYIGNGRKMLGNRPAKQPVGRCWSLLVECEWWFVLNDMTCLMNLSCQI